MVCLIAYAVFEVPPNYLLKSLNPTVPSPFLPDIPQLRDAEMDCLSVVLILGGRIIIGLDGTHNCSQLTAVRFLLGAVEVGLSPGPIYYLTFK